MPPDDKRSPSERERTDESLRVEREKADHALAAQLAEIDETADAVVDLARARADDLLATVRLKTDRQSATPAPGAQSRQTIESERVLEDRVVREERADADDTLREERAEQASSLSIERKDTDEDLLSERTRSDSALATRDEFLGIVGHDLRTMLNTLVGSAALIVKEASQGNDADRVRIHAQRIQRAGARMNRLIGDLVDVASIEAGALAVTRELQDPAHVVAEAVEIFQVQASAGEISLAAEIVRPLPPAAFDPARILQVLTNLLSNATKFTPAHGKVVVRVERVDEELRFAVSDTGVGIPPDKLEAVFVRFHQISHDRRGVGLGLYISKCIVQGHGGRIWAESVPGEGSTVWFTIPISGAPK